MPSFQTTTRGGVIRWDRDDWYAGISPFAQSGQGTGMQNVASVLEGKGFSFSIGIDPFRFPGLLSPGFAETVLAASSTISDATRGSCSYGTDAYLMTSSTGIYHLSNGTTFDGSVYKTITMQGTHAGHSSIGGDDAVYYKANVSSTPTLLRFYSYNDDNDGDVAMDNGGTVDWDFMSTATGGGLLSNLYPHPMIVGADDILYIANGSVVDSYDGNNGANGTFTATKLQLPKDFVINSFQVLPDYLVIFANKAKTTIATAYNVDSTYPATPTVFFWDYKSATFTFKNQVDCNLITASFKYDSTVGCFGSKGSANMGGGAGRVKLFMYDGTKFNLVRNMPASMATDVPRWGVQVLDETIYFTNTTGTYASGSAPSNSIFSYGKDFLGKWSLNCIATTTNSGESFLKSFKDQNLYTEGSSGHEPVRFTTDYFRDAKFVTPHISPPLPSTRRARIKRLKVQWGQIASTGRSFDLTLLTNKGQNTISVASGVGAGSQTITNANLQMNYYKDANGLSLGANFFESIALQGLYGIGGGATGIPPLLEFVEVYYDLVKI